MRYLMTLNMKDKSLYGKVSAKLNFGPVTGHIWTFSVISNFKELCINQLFFYPWVTSWDRLVAGDCNRLPAVLSVAVRTANNARRESWLISYSALRLGYCEWPGSWCMLYNEVVRSVLFGVPTLKCVRIYAVKSQWGTSSSCRRAHYCRKVNSKLSEVTDWSIALLFPPCILEFGQHSWLTEDLIRGHKGHETGNCHPPVGTSLGLYSLGLPMNKGRKHDNEERLVLLFAGFVSFAPFFGQWIPTRERSFVLFSISCAMSLFFQPHHIFPVNFDRILLLDVYSNSFIFGTQYKGHLLLANSHKAGTANGVSFAAAKNGEVSHPWLQSLLA